MYCLNAICNTSPPLYVASFKSEMYYWPSVINHILLTLMQDKIEKYFLRTVVDKSNRYDSSMSPLLIFLHWIFLFNARPLNQIQNEWNTCLNNEPKLELVLNNKFALAWAVTLNICSLSSLLTLLRFPIYVRRTIFRK